MHHSLSFSEAVKTLIVQYEGWSSSLVLNLHSAMLVMALRSSPQEESSQYMWRLFSLLYMNNGAACTGEIGAAVHAVQPVPCRLWGACA